jgi:ubiquinone/menaquinone biosynthesis methyltransferase
MTSSTTLLQNKAAVPSEFNSIAARYDLATWFSQGYQSDLNTSAERIAHFHCQKALDLCCGTGKSTLALKKVFPQADIIGIDNSKEMLQVAKSKSELAGVKFLQQDAMQLHFGEETFDVIFMAYGIRNMPDEEQCIRQLIKILKPGGVICFHEYVLNDGWFSKIYWSVLSYGFIVPFCTLLTGNFTIFNYLAKSVLHFYSVSGFEKLLKKSGFYEVKTLSHAGWRAPILKTVIAVK